MEDLSILCDRIRQLVERRPTAQADDVEHTLTDGYARALALEAFRTAGCYGWGRVDVMRDRNGNNYLLEVNTAPAETYRGAIMRLLADREAHRQPLRVSP